MQLRQYMVSVHELLNFFISILKSPFSNQAVLRVDWHGYLTLDHCVDYVAGEDKNVSD